MLDHGGMMTPKTMVACHACGCHAKVEERDCPHCGARLRRSDGTIPRAAAALLLGLTAAALPGGVIACSDESSSGGQGGDHSSSMVAYGVSISVSSSSSSGAGGAGGAGGMGGMGGMGGDTTGSAAAYGVPQTDADLDGYFDQNFGGDDCDDTNAAIHPGAVETAGDGVDSNCDGQDDT